MRLQQERDEAVRARNQAELVAKDVEKSLKDKTAQFDSLQKDFNKTQERVRTLLGQESTLST